MIIDKIEKKELYYALGKGFKIGFDFIDRCCRENLAEGRYDLDGTDVFAVVQEYESKTDAKYEGHTEYIDIQYIVSGEEGIDWKMKNESVSVSDYDNEKDVEFFDAEEPLRIPLKTGEFVILFPNDIHRPGMRLKESVHIKKVLVKIHI